jgi:circadian clock protein KaiB
MPTRTDRQTKDIIAAAEKMKDAPYLLRLYVAGMTQRSAEAIRRVTEFCEKYLSDRYELEIVDIYQKPTLMKDEQIIAVPTLVKRLPAPLRRFIGDMHNEENLLFGMDLVTRTKSGQ